jgi:hypothetical protein
MSGAVLHAIIRTDGTVTTEQSPLPLDRLQQIVGGYIDVVAAHGPQTPEGLHLVVNDEGLLHNMPINRLAGQLYYSADYPHSARNGIRGDVVIIRVDALGETASITQADADAIHALINERRGS